MKKLFLLLLTIPFLLSSTTKGDINHDFYGIWKTVDNEFVKIGMNSNFDVTFQRVSMNKSTLSKGVILNAGEGEIKIKRDYPQEEYYTSQYVFSPTKQTLVIMKPDGKTAWLLEKVSN